MDLEQVVRQYVFLGRPNNKGWCPTLCKVCNDHGKKGMRAAFNFTSGGCGYKCQNCGISCSHNPGSPFMPSDDFKVVFRAFGIPDDIISELELLAIQHRADGSGTRRILAESKLSGPKVLELPSFFIPIQDIAETAPIRELAQLHLADERCMTETDYPFYIGVRDDTDPQSFKWANRLIIPMYDHNNRLIFYQGRDLIGTARRKYESASTERDQVLYGMSEVHNRTNAPLFVVEGFFDAFHLKGVAVLGRDLSPANISVLNSCPREKIVVPDRYGDGADLAMAAIKLGWKVSTPDLGQCKDVTEAIVKYGKLYVYKNIIDNVYAGTVAEAMVQLYCSTKS